MNPERFVRMITVTSLPPIPPSPATTSRLPLYPWTPSHQFLSPSPPTYNTDPPSLRLLSSSLSLNIVNDATTSVHLPVAAAGTKSEPHLRTAAYPDPTPFLPTYIPDLIIIHTHIEHLRTLAPPNHFLWCQIYWLNAPLTDNLDAHLISALNENIPQFLPHPTKM
jgi:hypothetical protein